MEHVLEQNRDNVGQTFLSVTDRGTLRSEPAGAPMRPMSTSPSDRQECLSYGKRLANAIKELLFLLYLNCGYVQLRDAILSLIGRSRATIVYYHRIGQPDVLTRSVEDFRADLQHFKHHYECISLAELVRRISNKEPFHRRVAVITFDDGYRDNFTHAVPELRAAALTATFFVSTGFINTDRVFGHDAKHNKRFPTLTWDDLRAMQSAGFDISGHTVNHTNLGSADESTIRHELTQSLEALNTNLGERPRSFSFCWGKPKDISSRAIKIAKQLGYYAISSAYGGANSRNSDPFALQRVDVGNGYLSRNCVRARVAGFDPDYWRLCRKGLRFAAIFAGTIFATMASAKTIYVSTQGSDSASGVVEAPVKSPNRALDIAQPGDAILLHEGHYAVQKTLWIDKPSLTLAAFPGERATLIASNDDSGPVAVISIVSDNVVLRWLDIRGGSYYGIKIDVDKTKSTTGVTIRDCSVQSTGRDCVKTTFADKLLIDNCDIGHSGVRDPSNAEGIDSVGSVGVNIRNCHIHDTATNGIYLKGAARDGVIENCIVENTGDFSGILLGQDTDVEYMRDGMEFEAINCVARNNIIKNTGAAGLGTYSGSKILFENNKLINVAKKLQAGLWVVTNSRGVPGSDISFMHNTVVVGSARPFVMIKDLSDHIHCDQNIYCSHSPQSNFRCEDSKRKTSESFTLAQWQKAKQTDLKSSIGNPDSVASREVLP